ncbi:putative ATPase [Desulforapulum autotrophicum HRM2]|uniref:ATPase n=1 Tax=Desulforapulum autotrophicum (strain ATCC 43914 / DSM 3382 / VKM B-1955 / HRM2) TaxID=177437 RepID=C0QLJ5_DESAH|nr:DUF3426 domain-containing protein [Desulforapulum autotrophicum]ACN16299.1 putative ATPase [Desulforapulum autotrophicum HRM2]
MVITCEECSTRFNLDESLLKEEGSKVRCCKCRHVFTVFPSLTQIPIKDAPPQDTPQDKDNSERATATELDDFTLDNELDLGFSVDPDDLTLDDDLNDTMDSEDPLAEESFDLGGPMDDNDDFFLDNDLELELDQNQNQDEELEPSNPNNDLEMDNDSDALSLDGDMDFDDEFELELEDYGDLDLSPLDSPSEDHTGDSDSDLDFDLELDLEMASPEPALELDLEMDETQEEPELELDLGMESIEPALDEPQKQQNEREEDINLSEFDEVLEAVEDNLEIESPEQLADGIFLDTPDTDDTLDDELLIGEEYPPDPDSQEREKDSLLTSREKLTETAIEAPPLDFGIQEEFKKPVKVGKPVIAVLLLAILALAAYSASIFYGIKIPYVSAINVPFLSDFLKPAPQVPVPINLAPDKKSVNGRFVTNTTAGTLFVITGSVTNTSKEICSHIKIKGVLITKDKVPAKNKTVFCGNLIDEELLKSVDMNQINTLLARETGNNLSNVNIQPGRSIPFMVVFSDLPENLENFTVNVDGFERVAK